MTTAHALMFPAIASAAARHAECVAPIGHAKTILVNPDPIAVTQDRIAVTMLVGVMAPVAGVEKAAQVAQ